MYYFAARYPDAYSRVSMIYFLFTWPFDKFYIYIYIYSTTMKLHNVVLLCLWKLYGQGFTLWLIKVKFGVFTVLYTFLDLLQFVLENSSREDKHECPFARSSIQLTLILCEILRIGEPRKFTITYITTITSALTLPRSDSETTNVESCCFCPPPFPSLPLLTASETGSDYHPIFFSQDRLMDELFCVCIQLLNKTWKEMRATQEDFDKVQ